MPAKPFDLRVAKVSDAGAIATLAEAYWAFERIEGFESAAVSHALEQLLADPALGIAWVACRDDGEVVAYLLGVYVFSLENLGLTAEIDEFYVVPEWRGTGLGRALLARAESAFWDAGCASVSLRVGVENTRARSFYLRQGYALQSGFGLLEKPLAGVR